jgi:hypothetical protein
LTMRPRSFLRWAHPKGRSLHRLTRTFRNELFALYCPDHGAGSVRGLLCNECATSHGCLGNSRCPGRLRTRRTHRIEPVGDSLRSSCDCIRSHGRPRNGPQSCGTRRARCRPERHKRPLT